MADLPLKVKAKASAVKKFESIDPVKRALSSEEQINKFVEEGFNKIQKSERDLPKPRVLGAESEAADAGRAKALEARQTTRSLASETDLAKIRTPKLPVAAKAPTVGNAESLASKAISKVKEFASKAPKLGVGEHVKTVTEAGEGIFRTLARHALDKVTDIAESRTAKQAATSNVGKLARIGGALGKVGTVARVAGGVGLYAALAKEDYEAAKHIAELAHQSQEISDARTHIAQQAKTLTKQGIRVSRPKLGAVDIAKLAFTPSEETFAKADVNIHEVPKDIDIKGTPEARKKLREIRNRKNLP